VDNQQRYNQLVKSYRLTLTNAFSKAGWRTVSDIPSDELPWPQGPGFYHYDQLYDRRNVGCHGPTFSYASMPDQYTLAAFQRLELSAAHRPLMAEIDLVSSHTPWTPLPTTVPWNELGDGSIFDAMPAQGLSPSAAWRHTGTVRRLYGQSIQYPVRVLASWIARLHDDNLVVVMLGDHQPNTTVSGPGANHLVPVSIVAHDPAVLGPHRPMALAARIAAQPNRPDLGYGRLPRPLLRRLQHTPATPRAPTGTVNPRGRPPPHVSTKSLREVVSRALRLGAGTTMALTMRGRSAVRWGLALVAAAGMVIDAYINFGAFGRSQTSTTRSGSPRRRSALGQRGSQPLRRWR
jgi:hypothetical protein